jgi:hypothetical protein
MMMIEPARMGKRRPDVRGGAGWVRSDGGGGGKLRKFGSAAAVARCRRSAVALLS